MFCSQDFVTGNNRKFLHTEQKGSTDSLVMREREKAWSDLWVGRGGVGAGGLSSSKESSEVKTC